MPLAFFMLLLGLLLWQIFRPIELGEFIFIAIVVGIVGWVLLSQDVKPVRYVFADW